MQEWHIDIDDASTCSFTFYAEQKNREYNDDRHTQKKKDEEEEEEIFSFSPSLALSSFFDALSLDNDWFTSCH